MELLEVPQLMDACIRNNLYEEAVEIIAFANTLERRHLAPHRRLAAQQQQQQEQMQKSTSSSAAAMDDLNSSSNAAAKTAKHTVVIAGLVCM